jgi:hypothetical protein
LVFTKADGPTAVSFEVLSFGTELAVRASEEKVFADEVIECGNVSLELRFANARFHLDNLRIILSDERALHRVHTG